MEYRVSLQLQLDRPVLDRLATLIGPVLVVGDQNTRLDHPIQPRKLANLLAANRDAILSHGSSSVLSGQSADASFHRLFDDKVLLIIAATASAPK